MALGHGRMAMVEQCGADEAREVQAIGAADAWLRDGGAMASWAW